MEGQGVEDDDRHVQRQAQPPDGQAPELVLEQPGRQLRAPRGRAHRQQQAGGDAQQHAAVNARQHGVHGLEGVDHRHSVQDQRADGHRVQRREHEFQPQLPGPHVEQGEVEQDHRDTHRQRRQQVVDDLGDAGKAAHGDPVGLEEPVERQRVNGAAHGDDAVAVELLQNGIFDFH